MDTHCWPVGDARGMADIDSPFQAVVRRAGRDHQIVVPRQVLARWEEEDDADPEVAALARSTLYRRLRAAGHEPRHRGVWLPAGLRRDAVRDAVAAYRAIGDPMALTGGWVLWATKVVSSPPARPTVLVPASRTLAVTGFRMLRSRQFHDVSIRRLHDVPTVAVPRGIADYATEGASLRKLSSAIVDADRLRRCSLAAVQRELERRPRFAGRPMLVQACVQLAGELSHSQVEGQARRRLRQLEPAFTARPFKVERGGKTLAEVDTAVVQLKYAVEVDGPYHLWPDRQIADRQRDQKLSSDGWTIDRFWWFEIEENLEDVVQRVRRRLEELGWHPTGE